MTRWLAALLLLTLVYLLALSQASLADALLSAGLSTGLLLVFRGYLSSEPGLSVRSLLARLLAFLPFAGVVAIDILQGMWEVALVTLGIRRPERAGIVGIPIGERSRTGVSVSALVISLSPGSVLVDIDWERRLMYFHFLDASDPELLREKHRRFYDRYQRDVFP